jgi:hypothetical protein
MNTEPRLAALLTELLYYLAERPSVGTMLDVADFLRADETVDAMAYGASWWADVRTMLLRARAEAHAAMN